jgi:hypothetical protein
VRLRVAGDPDLRERLAQHGEVLAVSATGQPETYLTWAYAIPQPPPGGAAPAAPAPDTTPRQLPGSTLTFTRPQISDGFGPADWFPGDHPTMPEVVAKGKRPDVRACSLCHYPNGKGRPENAGVSGLPVSYFIQQMNDFRTDVRKSAEVVFGPAGRPLPQLPLSIDANNNIVAAGGYVGNIGPAWWGVRKGT